MSHMEIWDDEAGEWVQLVPRVIAGMPNAPTRRA